MTTATLLGCAIGDALGMPFEMKSAISPILKNWDGMFKAGGTFWKGSPGQYTDDTLMSIALATSLIEKSGFDPDDVAAKYLAWYNSGNTRGIGSTTAEAMVNLKLGMSSATSGKIGSKYGGNGTAMRAAPLGIAYRDNIDLLIQYAARDAIITHNSLEPQMGSIAVAFATALLANGEKPFETLEQVIEILPDCVVKEKLTQAHTLLQCGGSPDSFLPEIGSSGYVPETVGTALFCLAATSNFKDGVIMAIRAGGDTDTTAAIVGALAGTYYGLDAIPAEYKDNVENAKLLTDLDDELFSLPITCSSS